MLRHLNLFYSYIGTYTTQLKITLYNSLNLLVPIYLRIMMTFYIFIVVKINIIIIHLNNNNTSY